jgi:Family of unknown function (DUF6326)
LNYDRYEDNPFRAVGSSNVKQSFRDVLRIFAGDFVAGEMEGVQVSQKAWLGIAVFMVIPIFMVFLSLTLDYPVIRWANIIVAIIIFAFNLISLPTYPSAYDKFLIIVGLGLNVLTVRYAWKWAA